MDPERKTNKRKPSISLTSDDSSENSYNHKPSLSSWSNMNKRVRKKKTASVTKVLRQARSKPTTPRRTNITTPKPVVNTSNTYAVLTDNDDENIVDNNASRKTKAIKAIKIPPIICVDAKYADMVNIMRNAKIENFSMKYISMGIKVFCNTLDDFETVRLTLKNKQVQYFTHDIVASKSQKFVLSGLPNFQADE